MTDFLTISGMTRADLVRLLQATRRNLPVAEGTEPSRTSLQGRAFDHPCLVAAWRERAPRRSADACVKGI